MNMLHPRSTYHRAHTDETDFHRDHDMVELASLHTTYSSRSETQSFLDTSSTNNLVSYLERDPHVSKRSKIKGRLAGWRFGAASAAILALVSLVVNLTALVWLVKPGVGYGLVSVYTGDCQVVQQMGLWVHLAINIISTLLLGGSNYCMQCLSSPTRTEVDKAHSKGRYLDIGVPNFRNLESVATNKVVMWWILAISSIPLHLLYNSAFYGSLSNNEYEVFLASSHMADGSNFTTVWNESMRWPTPYPTDSNSAGTYHRLEVRDCINQYARVILPNRRNLILVSGNRTSTTMEHRISHTLSDDLNYGTPLYRPFDWICDSDPWIASKIDVPRTGSGSWGYADTCDTYVSKVEDIAPIWTPFSYSVSYCLSEVLTETCSFNGNIGIIATVIACNVLKAVMMFVVAFRLKGNPLITIGDALESFLNHRDTTTKGLCWLTRQSAEDICQLAYRDEKKVWPVRDVSKDKSHPKTIAFGKTRWRSAASRTRWVLTIGLVSLAILASTILLSVAIVNIHIYQGSIWNLGIGEVHVTAIIFGWSIDNIRSPAMQVLASILIANLPQAILSFLYLNLNGLVTSMWLAAEWNDFAKERKTLRVSSPKGEQRGTHFLQLPYKVAVPLMIMSGLLHWLVSQSIFLAVVAEWDSSGHLSNPVRIASCGYSPIAMIITIGLGLGLIGVIFCIGRRWYESGIPVVGSCSAAISAACHRPDWDHHAAMGAVQYGEVAVASGADAAVRHCALSSGEVGVPERDRLYA